MPVALPGPEKGKCLELFVFQISCSFHAPCFLQHFEAGSWHFNSICGIFELNLSFSRELTERCQFNGIFAYIRKMFRKICNMLVLELFMKHADLQLGFM